MAGEVGRNHTAAGQGNLTPDLERLLRALPDPGAHTVTGRGGSVRAIELVAGGLPGYPELTELETRGLAFHRRGWWRKTREGVLYLRSLDA